MNSTELCASIAKTLPSLFECSPASRGGVRVRTPLLYPDGGIVDVFVLECANIYIVTDFGEALGWLGMQTATARLSPNQQSLIKDVCQTLRIDLRRGQLVLRSGMDDDIGEGVLRVAQAVVRVSDLWFTFRHRALQTTADEVDEWLREKQITFERTVSRRGRSGQHWTIDYQTHTDNRTSLVFLLSAGSRGAARRITEHVLAGCVDLSDIAVSEYSPTLVSLFDDKKEIWKEGDFQLVRGHSEIARWSRPDEFEQILRAS